MNRIEVLVTGQNRISRSAYARLEDALSLILKRNLITTLQGAGLIENDSETPQIEQIIITFSPDAGLNNLGNTNSSEISS